MTPLKIIILIILFALLTSVGYFHRINVLEEKMTQCLTETFNTLDITTLNIEVENRSDAPIVSGKVTHKQKQELINVINKSCGIETFIDNIEGYNENDITEAYINFELDGFNQKATIIGLVNSAFEHKAILTNFSQAINQHYGEWTIEHEILISKLVQKKEFEIDLTLALSALSLVKKTDLTLINDRLIIKGLVRNKTKLESTIKQLNELFQEEKIIVNQLQEVILEPNKIKPLELEPLKLPKLPEFDLSDKP
ncbi:MAG: hypothetical protein AB8B80_01100 [Marinicellaceae bacterium]